MQMIDLSVNIFGTITTMCKAALHLAQLSVDNSHKL